MKRLGIVVGTPKVNEFNFGAKVNGDVRKGQLVETITNNNNRIISQVTEIIAINEYFGKGSILQHLHRTDLNSFLDKTVFLATAIPLAMLNKNNNKNIEPPDIPVALGSWVYPVSDNETAKTVFGFVDYGIHLGTLMYNDAINVNLDTNRLILTHVALLAQTGGGKTYTVMIMLEEFLNKSLFIKDDVLEENKSKIHFLIIDIHGEYAKRMEKHTEIFVFNGPFTIPINEIPGGPNFIREIAPEMTEPQFRLLEDAWNKIKKQKITINDLLNSIMNSSSPKQKQTESILLYLLEKFLRYKLFGNEGSIDLLNKISENKLLILDFSHVTSYIQQIYLRYALNKVFNGRTKGEVPPLCIVIEEVHNFAPSIESSIPRNTIRNIAREGRKFGIGLCITSQRPSMIDTTLVSQCSTIIALRTTNESDLRSISAIAEGFDTDILRKIPPGIALIAGRAVNYPIYVKIKKIKIKNENGDAFIKPNHFLRIDEVGQARFFSEYS